MTWKAFCLRSAIKRTTRMRRGVTLSGARRGAAVLRTNSMQALPDLEILVQRRHVTDDAILLEVIIFAARILGGAQSSCNWATQYRSLWV